MSVGLLVWVLVIFFALFHAWWNWPNHPVVGGNLLLLALLGILGWHNWPIHG